VHVGFFGAVDHLAEGTLILMGHRMDGEFKFMVHEGYFSFPGLIPSTTLKVGKILYDAGRINTVHRMMWPFTDAPLVYKELLAENGASDTGGEARILMPWTFWQELSVGVFNGQTFGHAMSDGPNKQNPLFTSHLKQFFNLGDNLGTQFGVSYLRFHPDPNPNKISHQTGIDFLLKWKNGYMKSFQWMAEVWYRETRQKNERPYDQPAPPVDTRWGSYSFWEYQIDENWFIGLRMDYFTVPTLRGKLGYTFPNGRAEESIVLTYRPSHFSYFRVTAVRGTTIETGKHDFRYYFQADFVLGKHPAHAY